MQIRKNTIVLIERKVAPSRDNNLALVREVISDGWFKVRDWHGRVWEYPLGKLAGLAQYRGRTRSVRKALASCYKKAVMRLVVTNEVLSRELKEAREELEESKKELRKSQAK